MPDFASWANGRIEVPDEETAKALRQRWLKEFPEAGAYMEWCRKQKNNG